MLMDSFGSRATITVDGREYKIARLGALAARGHDLGRLPYGLRILLENLLRFENGTTVTAADIEALVGWRPGAEPAREISFVPARVILQDFTGVPAVVDLAAMRDAIKAMGGDSRKVNPLMPAELVIDHSVQVDEYGIAAAFLINVRKEYERNRERYAFLRWGQQAFSNFKVVPPGTGIVHQVNLEYLARVVMTTEGEAPEAYPDTLVGTDSHTTMINGLGVLGWGVGGIEAEAAMLGEPVSMLIPQVVGFKLTGRLPEGATATDLVLRVTEMLRKKGVVEKFVEFYGPGLAELPLADRATIANMAPEYGATCGIFPLDDVALRYLEFTGRPKEQVALVEAYMREQGLFYTKNSVDAEYSDRLELDLGSVEPSLAGPRRPQDRVSLSGVKGSFQKLVDSVVKGGPAPKAEPTGLSRWEGEGGDGAGVAGAEPGLPATGVKATWFGREFTLDHGSVVIAAITSCTNTSNPSVMLAAGLVAKRAVELGLEVKPWVKTSLAPGSKVVTRYLDAAGLTPYLNKLRFNLVGFGCTTCIGNSGPLAAPISRAIEEGDLVAAAVLSGNRNFEGRINPDVRANYLASPPLVVAYALAGRVDIDLYTQPLGNGAGGKDVYLKELWPTSAEVAELVTRVVRSEMFEETYADVFQGDEEWAALPVPEGDTYAWDPTSTYVKKPPFLEGLPATPGPLENPAGARVLAVLGDSVTTDHISPAGSIAEDSPAGRYLIDHGVAPEDFNSYGSRRGNHEVMVRGTFANIRLRNRLVPGVEGGYTLHFPDGRRTTIYEAAMRYQADGVPTVVIAGKEYGSGSSRDWAAKGPRLLGVRAVIAESYERIHRSNLVGMGLLPLQFNQKETAETLGLTGAETYFVKGAAEAIGSGFKNGRQVSVRAVSDKGVEVTFTATIRIDTPQEVEYYRHGGILPYVLRKLHSARA